MQEAGDILAALELLEEKGVITLFECYEYKNKKLPKLHKFLQSQ